MEQRSVFIVAAKRTPVGRFMGGFADVPAVDLGVAAARAALEIISAQPERVDRLKRNAAALRDGLRAEGLEPIGFETQIVPLVIGEADDAMALCERLLAEGVFAQAIRPPTVPAGTCRLRLTTMATHRVADLRRAAGLIGGAARDLGLAPGTVQAMAA
jgi:glycine C-acetyltransferase/8-amino-7-oxononanoate synthase